VKIGPVDTEIPATRLNSNADTVAEAVVVVAAALNAFLWRGLHSSAVGCRMTARPETLPLL